MSGRGNPVVDAVAGLLDQHDIAFELRHRGKHPSICFAHGGRTHRVTVPVTPSDQRAAVNARAFVRRILRREVAE